MGELSKPFSCWSQLFGFSLICSQTPNLYKLPYLEIENYCVVVFFLKHGYVEVLSESDLMTC